MKIAYFKNINKMLNFVTFNKVLHIFEHNGFIVVLYETDGECDEHLDVT